MTELYPRNQTIIRIRLGPRCRLVAWPSMRGALQTEIQRFAAPRWGHSPAHPRQAEQSALRAGTRSCAGAHQRLPVAGRHGDDVDGPLFRPAKNPITGELKKPSPLARSIAGSSNTTREPRASTCPAFRPCAPRNRSDQRLAHEANIGKVWSAPVLADVRFLVAVSSGVTLAVAFV